MKIYDISINDFEGSSVKMSKYAGKALLIVNVASYCGYTPQYKGLQALHQKYNNEGLQILAFPCNDFANQEPSSNSEIKEFCDCNYGVMFGIFEKIKIRGNNPHSLYNYLEAKGFPVMRPGGFKAKLLMLKPSLLLSKIYQLALALMRLSNINAGLNPR